jgi:acetyltransferase-like isoleucine patch superfamily enzyme
MRHFEDYIFKVPTGLRSRLVVLLYKIWGMKIGTANRFEKVRVRRANQIQINNNNSFTSGYMLWPLDENTKVIRIMIGSNNYFNKSLMIDACGYIQIGNNNMFGPDVYITDSNHSFGKGILPKNAAMQRGKVLIGNDCWIGAKAIILKDVELGDSCVVAAGAVVTKSFPAGSVVAGVPARLLKNDL